MIRIVIFSLPLAWALAAFWAATVKPRAARAIWWLAALLATGTAALVVLLFTHEGVYRAMFGSLTDLFALLV